MTRTLILYSTNDGQTLKICQRLKAVIEATPGQQVTLASLKERVPDDWQTFDRLVIGASIRYGHHGKEVLDFMRRHAAQLQDKNTAFFSVNLVARKPEKAQPETNPYLRKFLRKLPWRPKTLAVFAGMLDYPSYTAFDRWVIRLIMWITKGPTDPHAVVEFTDWQKVDEFAANLLQSGPVGEHTVSGS